MAKTKYTKEQIVAFIKDLDTRAKSLSDEKIDYVIDRGYAELATVSKRLFSNEEVVPLSEFYNSGETRITLDIEEDVTEVYDFYVTVEGDNTDKSICQEVVQGIGIYRNSDLAYRDNRYIGRVHLDLSVETTVFDNAVTKYYYTPKATDSDVYMDSQVYIAFQDAIWASLNYFMKDVEGEAQKRASMIRTGKSTSNEPEDLPDFNRSVFFGV